MIFSYVSYVMYWIAHDFLTLWVNSSLLLSGYVCCVSLPCFRLITHLGEGSWSWNGAKDLHRPPVEVGLYFELFKENCCWFVLLVTRPTLGLEGLPLSAEGTLSGHTIWRLRWGARIYTFCSFFLEFCFGLFSKLWGIVLYSSPSGLFWGMCDLLKSWLSCLGVLGSIVPAFWTSSRFLIKQLHCHRAHPFFPLLFIASFCFNSRADSVFGSSLKSRVLPCWRRIVPTHGSLSALCCWVLLALIPVGLNFCNSTSWTCWSGYPFTFSLGLWLASHY